MMVSADRKPKADRIHLEGIRMGKLSFVSVSNCSKPEANHGLQRRPRASVLEMVNRSRGPAGP